MTDPRRQLPSVDRLLESQVFERLLTAYPRERVASALRAELDAMRAALSNGRAGSVDVAPEAIAERTALRIDALAAPTLVRVINATGVVLHTNLGRAPLAAAALEAIRDAAAGYTTLEYDLEAGVRGSRYDHCRTLLAHLTGAADALVVNNNAAALVLALDTFARGRAAVISRGELVEIGGGFRVPEIMERSGALMREVGATNRTHLDDYARSLDGAGAVVKVHRSNFRMHGYVAEASTAELAAVCSQHDVPLIHDLGSGLLLEPGSLNLPANEPTVSSVLSDGAHIVCFSGDKLLGGPQCGVLVGSRELVGRMRSNPLCRALRPDKLTLAALAATLRLHLDPDSAVREIPAHRMLTLTPAELEPRAGILADRLVAAGIDATVIDGESAVGGGALPDHGIPSRIVRIAVDSATAFERRLRAATTPVVARVADDSVLLDLRTVLPEQDTALGDVVIEAAS